MLYNRGMKIVIANTSRATYGGIVKEIKKNLSQADGGIVIAPDRFTASVERGLLDSLGVDSSFNLEVMSFTRLANKLIGKDIKKCLTPEGSVMLIGKVIDDNRDKLSYYGKAAMVDGFANELYAALTAIRNSGVSSTTLRESAQNMPVALRAKSEDIALIYEGYLAALEGKHSDSSTRLYALAQYLADNPSDVADTDFYCTDIYEFSAPELDIIAGLAKSARSLTVGVTSGFDNPNKRIYPDRVIAKLRAACPDSVQTIVVKEELCAPLAAISEQLFSYNVPSSPVENNGKISLRRTRDREDEVLWLALDILKRVREGARYRDFEVYLSDEPDYEQHIKSVFQRYGIPFYIDKKELLSEQTKVRYILSAIACVRSGFRVAEVLDFVKNPLFCAGVEGAQESVFRFENYVMRYNIDYGRFTSAFTLYDEAAVRKNPDAPKECDIPEKVRKALINAVYPLNLRGKQPIERFVRAVEEFLNGAENAWQSHVEKLSNMSAYYSKCAEQVDSKIKSVLEEIESVLKYDTDIAGFESIFKSMLKTLRIALVPTYLDCVFFGGEDSRFMGRCDVYILGATNGKLPSVSGGGAVITQKDEELLAGFGVNITPNERQKVMTAMYAVCDLMKKPHGRLVISYPETGSGGALRPSTVIAELRGMLSENSKPIEVEYKEFDRPSHLERREAALLFTTDKGCYHQVLRNAVSGRVSGEEMRGYAEAYKFVADGNKIRIESISSEPERIDLPQNSLMRGSTSVSRLEAFYACPYSHYFKYILSLKKRKDGKPEDTENGIILHYVLEKFFKDLRDGIITEADEVPNAAYKYFEDAVRVNGFENLTARAEVIRTFTRLKQESAQVCCDLYEIYHRSQFKPLLLEARIGEGEIKPMSLNIGDGEVRLRGTIDRVDVLDDRFIVIDYKTYKSADLELKEIYYGQKIQLYVYMRAIEDSLGAKPAGVFYLPVFAGFSNEETSRYKYKGQSPDSFEVMAKIDSIAKDNPKDSTLPYKSDRKGGLSADTHLSVAQFDKLGDYAMKVAAVGAEQISNGYIKPLPYKDKCNKCDFSHICAYKDLYVRKTDRVSMASFNCIEKQGYESAEGAIDNER